MLGKVKNMKKQLLLVVCFAMTSINQTRAMHAPGGWLTPCIQLAGAAGSAGAAFAGGATAVGTLMAGGGLGLVAGGLMAVAGLANDEMEKLKADLQAEGEAKNQAHANFVKERENYNNLAARTHRDKALLDQEQAKLAQVQKELGQARDYHNEFETAIKNKITEIVQLEQAILAEERRIRNQKQVEFNQERDVRNGLQFALNQKNTELAQERANADVIRNTRDQYQAMFYERQEAARQKGIELDQERNQHENTRAKLRRAKLAKGLLKNICLSRDAQLQEARQENVDAEALLDGYRNRIVNLARSATAEREALQASLQEVQGQLIERDQAIAQLNHGYQRHTQRLELRLAEAEEDLEELAMRRALSPERRRQLQEKNERIRELEARLRQTPTFAQVAKMNLK